MIVSYKMCPFVVENINLLFIMELTLRVLMMTDDEWCTAFLNKRMYVYIWSSAHNSFIILPYSAKKELIRLSGRFITHLGQWQDK